MAESKQKAAGLTAPPAPLVDYTANELSIGHSLKGLLLEPVDLKNVEEIEKRFSAYVRDCIESGSRPTPPGFALWLGVTNRELADWMLKSRDDESRRTAARIHQFLEAEFANTAMTTKQSPQLSMFLAKNWFGYTDTTRIEAAVPTERKKTIDELAREAEALPDGIVVDATYKEVGKGKR